MSKQATKRIRKSEVVDTDRGIKALKPAAEGERYEVVDGLVRGLRIRVNDKGERVFVLLSRFPGSSNPTRRSLGRYAPLGPGEIQTARESFEALPKSERRSVTFDHFLLTTYGATTLNAARLKAREWLALIARGIDPSVEEEKQRMVELRRQENSFAAVAEAFIGEKLKGQRKGEEVERDIRRVFIKEWGGRPITDISQHDVKLVVKQFRDAGKLYQAHNLLSYARRLFNWAITEGDYGLEASPCDRLKPKDLIGTKEPRTRVLTDVELCAAWQASSKLGYPYGPLFQMLILTAQRKSDVAEARWSEFDLAKRLWTIPAERMKADTAHVVPLSADVVKLLAELPRFNGGDLLFSTTFGKIPLNSFSRAKEKLDEAMLAALRSGADGDAARKIKVAPFVIHDLRRTARTAFSAFPGIADLVRELTIAHTRPGLHKVYDLHAYLDERRDLLAAWARRVMLIVDAPLHKAVEAHLVTEDDLDRNRRRKAYNEAILEGGDRWTTWLRSVAEPPAANVVPITAARG